MQQSLNFIHRHSDFSPIPLADSKLTRDLIGTEIAVQGEMSRRPRLQFPQIDYHVIVRCNNHAFRFQTDEDFCLYLTILRKIKKKHELKIYNYELMNTHVHLFLRPGPDQPLARSMQQINWTFSYFYNREKLRHGHLWLERYRNIPVESGPQALALMRYVNRNPVRAGMVRKVGEWKWSAYPVLAGIIEDPLISFHPVYESLGKTVEQRQLAYSKWVHAAEASQGQENLNFSDTPYIGTEGFGKRLSLRG